MESWRSRTGYFEMAKTLMQSVGNEAIIHYIISHTETVSRLLEASLLQKKWALMVGTLEQPDARLRI